MAIVRMTADQARASARVDHAKIRATTDDDVRRYMVEDGEDPDAPPMPHRVVMPPAMIRKITGLSQDAFAKAIGVPLATWRNWEQGRKLPDPAARSLLALVARDPTWVLATLEDRPAARRTVFVYHHAKSKTAFKVFEAREQAVRHAQAIGEQTFRIDDADYVRAEAQQAVVAPTRGSQS